MDRRNHSGFLACTVILLCGLSLSCSEGLPVVPDDETPCRFVVFSDVQQGYGIYRELAEEMGKIDPVPDAAVCCGDLMLRSSNEAEWVNFLRYSKPVTDRMPLYIARGNHDGNEPWDEYCLHTLGNVPGEKLYYSVTEHDYMLIILDTQEKDREASITGDQLEWLQSQLNEGQGTPAVTNIFVFMHHPLYPQGRHRGSNLANADELHRLFLDHPKVRVIFAGHDHIYNKYVRDGMVYITTGGGGGALYHGYGGDYHHYTRVSFAPGSSLINIKTIGIFNEVVADFDL